MSNKCGNSRIDWVDTTREVKRAVPLRQGFRLVDWRVRSRGRADCGLCEGHSRGTVAFNDRLWRCHRCLRGGSIFDLVMLAHNCDFLTALKFLAAEARVELPVATTPEEHRRLRQEAAERQKREAELDAACAEFEQQERSLRIECVQRIRQCDGVLDTPAPWDEPQWALARAAQVLRDEFWLPELTVLAFAEMGVRLHYVISDQRERIAMLAAVRCAGGVMTDHGHFVEVVVT